MGDLELEQWFSRGSSADPAIAVPDSATALLSHTSGTTAAPKGVPIAHGALMNRFSAAATEPRRRSPWSVHPTKSGESGWWPLLSPPWYVR